jgi:LysM repeat protein
MNRSTSQPVRLTRRGRALLLTTVAGVALGTIGVFNTAIASDTPQVATVVVQPGQSLWSIATAIDPSADPRATIHQIKALNSLEGSVVRVGQAIQVPAI